MVQPQLVHCHVVGDEDVGVAVAVEVRADHAEAVAESELQSSLAAHVRERAVAVVAEQHVGRRRLVVLRRAVGAHAGHVALEFGFFAPLDVVGEEDVQIAVRIQVQERGGCAPPRLVHAGCRSHVLEDAAAVVAQQHVRADVGDVEVHVAVVVVVAGGDAHAVAVAVGHIPAGLEVAVADVEVEAVRMWRLRRVEEAALHEVDVQVAVAVEVCQRGAAAGDFRYSIAAVEPGDVAEVDAALGRFVHEPCRAGRLRGRTRGKRAGQTSERG